MSTPEAAKEPIPSFTIDLAKAPRERYDEVIRVFGPRMRSLTGLYDDVLSAYLESSWLRGFVISISKLCLRKVYDEEETEEIKGISDASGVPLYLLIALNNLLDCMLGCTSGAVPVLPGTGHGTSHDNVRLMHFRTLDWGMDELRDLLVVLDFVNSSSNHPSRVIARSITYAGFVGSLTSVRKGLSISLNYRQHHDCSDRRLRWHQVLVLLGKRRSIGSIVRSFVLPHPQHIGEPEGSLDGHGGVRCPNGPASRCVEQATALLSIPSAPCYLIMCDGEEAAVVVKDCSTGSLQSSRVFIAQTNHDPGEEGRITNKPNEFEEWVVESVNRLRCIQNRWERFVQKSRESSSTVSVDTVETRAILPSITEEMLRRWLSHSPTLNGLNHFTTILDPVSGSIRWLMRGPVEDPQEQNV